MKILRRTLSLLLILAVAAAPAALCLSESAAASASESVTDEADIGYAALQELANSFDQVYPSAELLDSEADADRLCEGIYNRSNPEYAEKIYYGGPAEAAAILKQIQAAVYGGNAFSEEQFAYSALFYVMNWAVMHGDFNRSRPAVKEIMLEWYAEVWPEEAIVKAADICIDYMEEKEPELKNAGTVMYYNGSLPFNADGEYIEYFQTGYQLFEEGKYEEAIECYRKCLDYHAEGFFAEFEIVEAYLQLRDYGNAEKVLASIRPGLNQDTDKAKWLRRSGFIAVEKREYELAYALYVYSLSFEDNAIAHDEINYIVYTAPGTRPFTADEAESYLKDLGISFSKE